MPGSRFTDALSHADLGTLIEAIDEGFIVQDAALGVIAANTSAARLLGDTLALASYIDQIGQPIVPDQLPSRVALATGRAVKDVVVGVVRHDGRLLWLRVSAWPVDLGGGTPGVATLFVDVTAERVLIDEARRATDALTESETRLRSVLGSIDDYLYAWRYHADGSVEVDVRVDAGRVVPRLGLRLRRRDRVARRGGRRRPRGVRRARARGAAARGGRRA